VPPDHGRRVPVRERVLGRLLLDRAHAAPDRPFLRVGGGPLHSVGAVTEAALRVGGGLTRLGVGRGDPVAIMLPNRDEAVLAWLGTALIGAVEVPVNTNLRGPLLRHVLADCAARVLIVSADLLDSVTPLRAHLPITTVIVVGASASGTVAWDEVAAADPAAPAEVGPGDPIAVMYTSGTTGPAKGVVCPHGYFMCWADDVGRAVRFEKGDVLYTPLPLYHITAQAVNVQLALLFDGEVVVDARFSPQRFWARMAELRATHVWSFGSMTPLLHQQPPDPTDRAHAVRVVWSIPWPGDFGRDFENRFGVRILCGYGSTEQGLTVVQPYDAVEPGAIGVPSDYYDVAIVDEDGIPTDDAGELLIRPREPASMMTGYLGRPEETLRAWRDLWYHTGDLAHRRPDGYLAFVERASDSIRRRGENISAWEVERVVNAHPDIAESAVIGVANELADQDIKIFLRLKPGRKLDPADFIEWCGPVLPRFQIPRFVAFIDEFPKTPTERIRKELLSRTTEDCWDADAARKR
jgi:crotonobetaine/carnitine-CoA ligase